MSGNSPAAALRHGHGRVADALERAANWAEQRPLLLYGALCFLYVLFMLKRISLHPLWHDELFTFYIAQAPTLHDLFAELRAVDLNPPLVYLVTRASFHIFGSSTLACRLPDGLAFLAAMIFLGRLVARRLGNLYGFAASTILLTSPAGDLFVEARPYAFMLASLSLGWWMLDVSVERPARWRYALLTLAGCAAMLSHVLAVPAWFFLLLTAVSFRSSRRPAVLIAVALPFLLLPLLRPYITQHGHALFPPFFQPDFDTIFTFYDARVVREAILLGLTAAVLLLTFGFAGLRGEGSGWKLRRPDWMLAALWAALPGLLMGWFMVTHAAFWPRYGTLASLGVVVMSTALLAHWTGYRRSGALVVSLLALLIGHVPAGLELLAHPARLRSFEPEIAACVPCQVAERMNLPLVDASGLTFVEMSRREAASSLDRTYYLQDVHAAHTMAHASIFDAMALEQQVFHLRGHVVDAAAFEQTHSRFLVLGTYNYPEQWLLRKLAADGARVQILREDVGSYLDQDLYLVEMK